MVIATLIGVPLGLAIGASRLGQAADRAHHRLPAPDPVGGASSPSSCSCTAPAHAQGHAGGVRGYVPLVFQASYGITDVDPVAKDTARAFGMGPFTRLWRIVLPSCAPVPGDGLRISASIALILVVTGEYVVGLPGLGRGADRPVQWAAYDRMYALIIAAGLLGVALNLAFVAVERRVLFWHLSRGRRHDPVTPRTGGSWCCPDRAGGAVVVDVVGQHPGVLPAAVAHRGQPPGGRLGSSRWGSDLVPSLTRFTVGYALAVGPASRQGGAHRAGARVRRASLPASSSCARSRRR